MENFYVTVADVQRNGDVVVGYAPLLAFMTNGDIEDAASMGIAAIGVSTWNAAGVPAGRLWRRDGRHGNYTVDARIGWANTGRGDNWVRTGPPPARTRMALDDPMAERSGACTWVRNVIKRDTRSPSRPRVIWQPTGASSQSQSGVRWTMST